MTCCVAALARTGIVLVSDRMLTTGMITTEPDVGKGAQAHQDWWALFAGDTSRSVDIVLRLQDTQAQGSISRDDAAKWLREATYWRWSNEAESIHLAPLGFSSIADFLRDGRAQLGDDLFYETMQRYRAHSMDVYLMLAGFDKDGEKHIFGIQGERGMGYEKLVTYPFDSPGYHAIGSGSYAALYMMGYKNVSIGMPLKRVAYYAYEGKYFGELAAGVGTDTDMFILRRDTDPFRVTDKMENKLVKICQKIEPRTLRKKDKKRLRKALRKL